MDRDFAVLNVWHWGGVGVAGGVLMGRWVLWIGLGIVGLGVGVAVVVMGWVICF